MRRKLIFGVDKVDTTAPTEYQGVASGATLGVLRPGCWVTGAGGPLSSGASTSIDTDNPGGIVAGDYLHLESGGVVDTTSKFEVIAVSWVSVQFEISVTNRGSEFISWSKGDRLVLINDDALYPGHFVDLYGDDTTSTTISNPATLGNTGLFEGYVDSTLDVDISISGSGLTTKYYTDVAAEQRGSQQYTVASATDLELLENYETILVTGTTDIETLLPQWEGRRITIIFTGSTPGSMLHNVSGSATDGELILPLGGDIAPKQYESVTLECMSFSGTLMWVWIAGTLGGVRQETVASADPMTIADDTDTVLVTGTTTVVTMPTATAGRRVTVISTTGTVTLQAAVANVQDSFRTIPGTDIDLAANTAATFEGRVVTGTTVAWIQTGGVIT